MTRGIIVADFWKKLEDRIEVWLSLSRSECTKCLIYVGSVGDKSIWFTFATRSTNVLQSRMNKVTDQDWPFLFSKKLTKHFWIQGLKSKCYKVIFLNPITFIFLGWETKTKKRLKVTPFLTKIVSFPTNLHN